MVVAHNLVAMNANRMYNLTTGKQKKSTEKLSSGYRINRAADDAAGLAISEKMRRQIRGLRQASTNCQDGISLVQTADGAMAEVEEMLHRGTELSVKAANGTLSDEDREYIQSEIDQLKDEINKISDRTTFNELQILKGKVAPPSEVKYTGNMPSWASSSAMASGYLSDVHTTTNGSDAGSHPAATISFAAFNGSAAQMAELASGDKGFNTTCATCDNHYTINFTADPAKAGSTSSGQHYIYTVDISGCTTPGEVTDRIMQATGGQPHGHYTTFEKDADGNLLMYDYRNYVMSNASQATLKAGIAEAKEPDPFDLYIQAGAETGQHIDIKLPTISTDSIGITGANVMSAKRAGAAISAFKNALSYVNSERSRMGAYQNRLEHTIKNLDNVVENTTNAESAIRDTDMSKEMVQYSNNSVLMQAGQSMLAQANQSKQGVLSLIQG